jgi:hypothetical protein
MNLNRSIPWATLGVWLLTVIFAVVGGAVVIWGDPGALSFEEYMKIMGAFVVAHGVLGIGRGVKAGFENHALLSAPLQVNDLALTEGIPDDAGQEEKMARPPEQHV